jgi:hypothetical protein
LSDKDFHDLRTGRIASGRVLGLAVIAGLTRNLLRLVVQGKSILLLLSARCKGAQMA